MAWRYEGQENDSIVLDRVQWSTVECWTSAFHYYGVNSEMLTNINIHPHRKPFAMEWIAMNLKTQNTDDVETINLPERQCAISCQMNIEECSPTWTHHLNNAVHDLTDTRGGKCSYTELNVTFSFPIFFFFFLFSISVHLIENALLYTVC